MSWFEVDRGGLRQLLEGRDKSFILRELLQNAWDEKGVTRCDVHLTPIGGRPAVRLQVEDDAPEGFYDLRHAYTLYADTRKRRDPMKRGRFNLGEKQVLSLCEQAVISTTKGTVEFCKDGNREFHPTKRQAGSIFDGIIRMTRAELEECRKAIRMFLPPEGITTTLNGVEVQKRKPRTVIEATLTTEHQNGDGQWKRTQRKTQVEVHEPLADEKPMLYELGLPVVELESGDPWHVNVLQRVPLNTDRDNVSPAFLRDVRAEVLNKLADSLTEDEAAESWVTEATEDDRIESEAVEAIMTRRFGEKRVVADPNDPRSREKAIAAGYTIVPPRALPKATWGHVREAGAVPSSSALFPTRTADAENVPWNEWTEEMHALADLTRRIAKLCLDRQVRVTFYTSTATCSADYTSGTVNYNMSRLGKAWLAAGNRERQLRLIIHELGHSFGGHLDEAYYKGLAKIGAKLALMDRSEILGE